jgi:diguanylate cyclase (GGDEF)-like protein/PAS domain S-box-containing protein
MHPLQRFHDQGVLPQHVAVDALWQARSGQLWIGTESYGLLTYSPTSRTLEHWQAKAHPANRPTMQSNFVTDIVGDNRGRLWIATEGGGLHQALFDRSGKLTGFRAITRDDGLASGAITGILAVDDNEIWLSTTAGLTRYRPDSGTVKNFSVSNSFYNGSRFRTSSGELLFGGTEGLTRFFPGKVALNPHVPKVVITGVRLANRPVYPSPDGPVTTPFPFAERVTVPYNKNMLVISFSALDFSNPAKNLYRYRLEGFDRNWIDTDAGNRQAVYTNLEPGRYRFRVIASNSDGLWNQAGSQLNVVVLGPPWSSQWMRFGLIFFLVLAAGVTFWEFRQRQRLRSQHLRSLSESEERLSLALWASGDEFWDWNMRSGETVRMNELPLNVFPRHLLLEQPEALRNFVHEADVPSLLRSFLRHRAGKDLFFECTYRLRDFDEHWHWVQDRGKIVTWSTDGEPERMLGTMKDINTLKRTEEELGIVAKSLANISDAVWITDEDFTLVFVNKAFCRLTGRTEQEAIGASLRFAHVHNQDETFEENIKRYLRNEGKWQGELWEQGIEGDIFPIALTVDSVRNRDGETTHFIGVFSDISQEKQSEQQLRQLAEYDRLTGLYSHAKFLQELERRMAESEFRRQTQMALVMVSLDDFKNINDTFGMDTGDQVLTTVGRQLATLDDDLVCLSRFSGDEFCGLLLSPGQRDRLMEKAGTILKALKAPLNVDGREIRIAASMGLALFPDHATSPLALFEKAHAAMSHLKRAGGNGIQIFNEALEMRARFGSQLDTELRHAINHGELEVHANPRVDLATGKWIAAEVHLRWRSPKRGLLAASSFMPVAEQSGLVYDLAAWFIERLAELVDSMGSMSSGMPLAIPVLSGNVLKTDIFEPVVQNLKTRNIPLDHMEFIIPEHAMVAAHFSTQRCLELFLGEGIKVQVSAFGSTISTLDWVKGQWLSSVRLGRALVAGIGLHPAHDAAIQTLTGFAHAMQLPLQADGIETDQQVTALRTLGCDWGAGPLLGDALPIEDFLQALRRRQQGG